MVSGVKDRHHKPNGSYRATKGAQVIMLDGHFVWTGGYRTKEMPKSAGFRWNPDKKYWWTDDDGAARKLFDFADSIAKAEMGSPNTPAGLGDYRDVVLEAMKELASVCDFAKDDDGQGFGKSDAHLGHSLASKGSLTAEQAALGLPLVRLHRRQLPRWITSVLEPFIAASGTIMGEDIIGNN